MRILDEYPPLRLGLRAMQLVVFALLLGVLTFVAITIVLVATDRIQRVDPPVMTWTMIAAGALLLPAVLFARNRILRSARRGSLAGESATTGAFPGAFPGDGADLPQTLGRLFQGWRTATLLTAAGLEGAALGCTMATWVEGQAIGVIVALFFALLLLLFLPTSRRLEEWLETETMGVRTSSRRGAGVD